jgi:tetratricopeptide (TPR) repeat protein
MKKITLILAFLLAFLLLPYTNIFAQSQQNLSIPEVEKTVKGLLDKALSVSSSATGVQVPLPAPIAKAEKFLRKAPGGDLIVDQLLVMINDQVGASLKPATDALNNVTKDINQADVVQLTSGAENAVTQFLKGKVATDLTTTLTPLISKATAQIPVKEQFMGIVKSYNESFAGKMYKLDIDLDRLVTEQVVNAIFNQMIAKLELKIRQSPALWENNAMVMIFGNTKFSEKTKTKAELKAAKKAEKEREKAEEEAKDKAKEDAKLIAKNEKENKKEVKSERKNEGKSESTDNKSGMGGQTSLVSNNATTTITPVTTPVVAPVIVDKKGINSKETYTAASKESKAKMLAKDYEKAIPILQEILAYKPADVVAKADLKKAETELAKQIAKQNYDQAMKEAKDKEAVGDLETALIFYNKALLYSPKDKVATPAIAKTDKAYKAENQRITDAQVANYSYQISEIDMLLCFNNFTNAEKLGNLSAEQLEKLAAKKQTYSFVETFEAKNLPWETVQVEVKEKEMPKLVIEHNEFVIGNQTKDDLVHSLPFEFDIKQNFAIEGVFRNVFKKEGFEYGLVFGKSEMNNDHLFFSVSHKTKKDKLLTTCVLRKYKIEGKKDKPEILFTETTEIITDVAVKLSLKVTKEGNKLSCYVNEQLIKSVENEVYFGQEVGFQVESKEKIAVDELKINGFYKMVEPSRFSPPAAERRLVYKESFDVDKKIWKAPIEAGKNLTVRTENGKLVIKNFVNEEYWVTLPIENLDYSEDFTIEVPFKHRSEDSKDAYGLIFGAENVNAEDYFYFLINSLPVSECAFAHASVDAELERTMAIKADHHAINQLKIVKQGFSLFFYINGIFINKISGAGRMGNVIGFSIKGKQEIEIEEIMVMGSKKM